MGELKDRRARKKAQTRDQIRRTAQRLFAERGFEAVTIADVAATADVAVQTVFNHFATKEELFFSGRVPFLHGPADAVRSRDTSTGPVTALRGYPLQRVESYVRGAGNPGTSCAPAWSATPSTLTPSSTRGRVPPAHHTAR